ncbi:MAG: glutaredoxin family protein [Corynebacterium sp.]|nr:glutaredoxin family protein [Corynebacterium sp.]
MASSTSGHDVVLITREGCGSCVRVHKQILPVIEETGANLSVVSVNEDQELAMEFGDRVPVILVDDEEFACWEVDNEELKAALMA